MHTEYEWYGRKLRTGVDGQNEHPDRERFKERWCELRIVHSGLPEMRRNASRWLAPDEVTKREESGGAYVTRAGTPDAASLTGTYLTSMVLKNQPIIATPPGMDERAENISTDGESLDVLIRRIIHTSAKMGGIGVLVDWDKVDNPPRLRTFEVEAVHEIMRHTPEGESADRLWVVAVDHIETVKEGSGWKEVVQRSTYSMLPHADDFAMHRRVEPLDASGKIVISKDENRATDELMLFSGQAIPYIPFTMVNFDGNNFGFSESPTEPIAGFQVQYWQTDMILQEILYLSGFVQFWARGWSKQELGLDQGAAQPRAITSGAMSENPGVTTGVRGVPAFKPGASRVLATMEPNAQVGWAQVDAGACAQHFLKQKQLLDLMASAGALATQDGEVAKTATQIMAESSGTISQLGQFSGYASRDITQLLLWVAEIGGIETEWTDTETDTDMKLEVTLEGKFANQGADSALVKELSGLMGSVITRETLFNYLAKTGVTKAGQTFAEELNDMADDPLPEPEPANPTDSTLQ